MESQRYQYIQSIFTEVVEQPPEARAGLLESLCEGDPELKETVLRMLQADTGELPILNGNLSEALHQLLEDEPEDLPHHHIGPYRLLRLLGEGGMGVVYLAERQDLSSLAAIKILRDSALSPMRRERFANEQQMLAQLNHPSIARLYDAGSLQDGTPFIVMEYVEGIPLTSYVREKQLSTDPMLRLFRMVCEAVRYSHSQAIIHRDLKPSNILVVNEETVKLVDFGIGKQLSFDREDGFKTLTGLRLLTPAYSAPEQIRGEITGVQADVYSLGVILYELLAGRLPFDLSNQTPAQMEHTLEEQEPKPPSALGKTGERSRGSIASLAWNELDILCLTAMHKDPSRRYQSVEAFLRDLDHYLKCEPLEARPDSFRYRASKFVNRNRAGIAWAASACILLAGLGLFSALRISRARKMVVIEAGRTQQIQQFMLNLFTGGDFALKNHAGDPGAAPSEDLRVVTLLDRGARQARTLDRDPETQAELYQTLAGIYGDMGQFSRADPLLQSALQVREQLHGPRSVEAADTMAAMGLLRMAQGRPAEAEKLTRSALEIDTHLHPPNDRATAQAAAALGRVLSENGNYDQAIPILRQAVATQAGMPDIRPEFAVSVLALAEAEYYTGQFATAESMERQALALDEQIFGPLHPRVADDLLDLGEVQHALGKDVEAEKDYREALAIDRSWYGEKHTDTAYSMLSVGQSLIFQKRYDEAAPFIEGGLATQEEILGPSHPRVANAFNLAGLLEERRMHLDAAERDFTRVAEIYRSIYGDQYQLVAVAFLNLGKVHLDEKKYTLAERDFRGALDRFREKLPPDHPSTAIAEQRLGETLVLERKYDQAEAPLLDANRIFNKQTPPPPERILSVQQNLVVVYEHLNKPSLAALYHQPEPATNALAASSKAK